MKMNKLHIILGFVMLFLFSCREDSSNLIGTEPGDDPEVIIKIRTSYNGFVYKNAYDPLSNAEIFLEGKSVFTNDLGYFEIEGDVPEHGGLLTIKSESYFDAYAHISPSENGRQFVRVLMRERMLAGSFNASSPTSVEYPDNGTKVDFAPNAFTLNGNPYNGTVEVYMDYLDPSAENFDQILPGNLSAFDEEEGYKVLESYGMVNVELQTPSGEKLEITEEATLVTSIPEQYLSQAPSTIPLWYFDPKTGLWVEEGFANLEGNNYVGKVSHFTLWNCDMDWPLVTLTGNITATMAMPTTKVKVTWLASGQVRFVYTDSNGDFIGKVPADQQLLVEVLNPCGDPVWSDEIGPLSMDEHLNITVDFGSIPTSIISGNLECNSSQAGGAYLLVYVRNSLSYLIQSDGSGNFQQEILTCDLSEISFTSFYDDGTNLNQGLSQIVAVSPNIDLGAVATCNLANSFKATFDFDDGTSYIHNDTDSRPNGPNGYYAKLVYPEGDVQILGYFIPGSNTLQLLWQSSVFENTTFPTTYIPSPQVGNWSYVDFGNFIHVECIGAEVTNKFNGDVFPNTHFKLTVSK